MAVCLVCKDEATKARADQMLLSQTSVRDVAAGIGISKSAVDRHKRNCLAKTLLSAPTVVEGEGLPPEIQPGLIVRRLETPADYWAYKQWLLDNATTLVTKTAASDNPRLYGDAIKVANSIADSHAEGRGWIQKAAALQDNRTLNIFAEMKPEALMALRQALTA